MHKGSKGRLFETHKSHCVVSLDKTLDPLLRNGSTKEDRQEIVDWDVKHQHNQTKQMNVNQSIG